MTWYYHFNVTIVVKYPIQPTGYRYQYMLPELEYYADIINSTFWVQIWQYLVRYTSWNPTLLSSFFCFFVLPGLLWRSLAETACTISPGLLDARVDRVFLFFCRFLQHRISHTVVRRLGLSLFILPNPPPAPYAFPPGVIPAAPARAVPLPLEWSPNELGSPEAPSMPGRRHDGRLHVGAT